MPAGRHGELAGIDIEPGHLTFGRASTDAFGGMCAYEEPSRSRNFNRKIENAKGRNCMFARRATAGAATHLLALRRSEIAFLPSLMTTNSNTPSGSALPAALAAIAQPSMPPEAPALSVFSDLSFSLTRK